MSLIRDLSAEQNVEILSKAESSGRLRSDDCDQSPALDGSEGICHRLRNGWILGTAWKVSIRCGILIRLHMLNLRTRLSTPETQHTTH
ncbi:hypothetical protein CDAR_504001 [Caerostris darwini]|uniref:Uncharacterized protein n=1 Tax=Caerostris darwini TaxID=1538125 RepID=A0AAV4T926_9ARAC|nr:hypothetical protein CDAR_504001 [Caerostris darwini]